MIRIAPITLAGAKAWMRPRGLPPKHRHNGLPLQAVNQMVAAVVDDSGAIRGVGIAEIHKAPGLNDGYTAEISRVCTDGVHNGCTLLYGALRRALVALGWKRIITYTLESEPGTGPRAAGFRRVAKVKGRDWNTGNKRLRWLPGMGAAPFEVVDRVRWEWP